MMNYLRRVAGVPVVASKLVAEGLLFLANFTIQRQIVFAGSKSEKAES